jgi:hypothetical protein
MYTVEQLTLLMKKRDDLTRQIADTRVHSLSLFAQRRALDRAIKSGRPFRDLPLNRGDVDPVTGLVVGSPEYDQHLLEGNK